METVFIVWLAGVAVLMFSVGAYRGYTETEWEDFDWIIIMFWPMAIMLMAVVLPLRGLAKFGELVGLVFKQVDNDT